jgi:hypothetical protein
VNRFRFLIPTNALLFAVRLPIPARLTRLKAVGISVEYGKSPTTIAAAICPLARDGWRTVVRVGVDLAAGGIVRDPALAQTLRGFHVALFRV